MFGPTIGLDRRPSQKENLRNKRKEGKGEKKKTQRKNSVKPGNGVEPEPAPQ
jgi:hypothetical protein